MEKKFYAYILRCSDGSYYCGYTANLKNRVATHNSGTGAKYTRSRLPVELVYAEELADKSSALQREYTLKQLSHKQKEELADKYDKKCDIY